MRILVTGATGQLGYDVCQRLTALGIENKGLGSQDCDLTDKSQVESVFHEYSPDAVIHCAAYTAVDKAESEPDLCRKINVDGTKYITEVCHELDAKLIYISTDYVFDGKGDIPFEAEASINPQNVYGKTKAEGEAVVLNGLEKYFIVRISWVFGINGNNFVKTMLRLGAEKDSLNVVDDQVGSPTYTFDLAVLLADMIQTEKYGIYHATNEGYCSWAEFADSIMKHANLKCIINGIPSSEYPTPASRPLNSRLNKGSLDLVGFSRLPHWDDALKRYIDHLQKDKK